MFSSIQKLISFGKLINRGYGAYKYKIFLLTVLGFVSGVFEGIGVNALIPLFSLVTGGVGGGTDVISRSIQKLFGFLHIGWSVKYLLIFIATLFIMKAVILVASYYINLRIMTGYQEEMKRRLMAKMLKANWSHLLTQKLGHLETIVSVNVASASSLLGQIGNVVVISAGLFVYICVAVNISFPITLITVLLSGLLFFLLKSTFKKIKLVSVELEATNKEISHYIGENVLGMKTVKVMNVASQVMARSKGFFARMRHLQMRQGMYGVIRSSLMQPASIIVILFVFAFSYKLSSFNLGAFLAVMYLIKQIFSYAEQLQKKMLSVYSITPYLESIVEYEKGVENAQEDEKAGAAFTFAEHLKFDDVSFSYGKNNALDVLKNITITVRKGDMVGLIGPSGAGKTTLVDLVLRLLTPSRGEILLDGVNIQDINLAEWRNNIGYVSQDIFLINASIRENVRFYDSTISEEGIKEALKMAHIMDFVESCPNKLETIVGERGVMLSGGQRQRIIIARVLARKPKILVLDEATSALDNESEKKIHEVIENLKGKMTVLIIAHRLSTIRDADKLIIVENGEIREEGRPDDLIKDENSYFYKIHNLIK